MANYEVIVKTDPQDAPKEHELAAAVLLAYHFRADVTFLRPEHKKTPDLEINGTKWEVKSPKGNAKKPSRTTCGLPVSSLPILL